MDALTRLRQFNSQVRDRDSALAEEAMETAREEISEAVAPGFFVRVVLDRELPVGALDLDLGCRLRHPEDFVIVALAHAFATFTIAGRSSRSCSR